MIQQKNFFLYLIKFLGSFFLLFYGTEAIIGFSAPGNHYNGFVAHNLNFIDPFRSFLLQTSQSLLSVFGYHTYFKDNLTLSLVGGKGLRMVYSCIGYGVLSFWIAFVFANPAHWKSKAAWMIVGCVALCSINILRISLLLVATNKGWPIPFGWDHHTWFNIVAYGLIFGMIYCFDKSGRKKQEKVLEKRATSVTRHEKEHEAALFDSFS